MSCFAQNNQERFHIIQQACPVCMEQPRNSPQRCPVLHRTTKKGFISFNSDVLFCTERPRKVSYHSTNMSCFARSNQERFYIIQQACPVLHGATKKGFISVHKNVLLCTEQPRKVSYHSTKMSCFAQNYQERFHVIQQRCPVLHRTTEEGFMSFYKDVLFCTEQPTKVSYHSTKMSFFAQSSRERFHIADTMYITKISGRTL